MRIFKLFIIALIGVLYSISCGTSFKSVFVNQQTDVPQIVVDSLMSAYGLNHKSDFYSWPKMAYLSSDSITVNEYTYITFIRDTMYLINVSSFGDDNYEINFRKELRRK